MILGLLLSALAAPPEVHWVRTDDNAWVAITHHVQLGGPPVLLVHGVSSNHHFWDLMPGRSLALYLADRGWDVYNLDLRGHGLAERTPQGKRQRVLGTLDQHGALDLAAAIDEVQRRSGQPQLSYVGHSMGGMVLAVYLAAHPQPPLHSAVLVGSPLDLRDPDAVTGAGLRGAPLIGALGRIPTPLGARMLAAMGRAAPGQLDALLYNPDNVDDKVEITLMGAVVSPMHKGEIKQFGAMRHDGEFRSMDGHTLYREALAEVTLPTLFIAGRADHVVSPDRVFDYYSAMGSTDKAFVVASRANGFSADYGHLDLGLGDQVVEVFSRIDDWLEAHR